jgi:hypothetical protein
LVAKVTAYFENHVQSVKQDFFKNANILLPFKSGGVSELADEHDLGSCAERLVGSNPTFPTKTGISI